MTERIEIENLVEDYLPGPDDNADALSFLSEEIKKRLASSEENRRKRQRVSAGRRLRALQENIAAAQTGDGNGAQQGIFERYTAPAAEGTTFEGDRGDVFDGCFDDKPAAPASAGFERAVAEETVFEEPKESDIIIDDNSLNLFDGGFAAPENVQTDGSEGGVKDSGQEISGGAAATVPEGGNVSDPYGKPALKVRPSGTDTLAGSFFENTHGFTEFAGQPAAVKPEQPTTVKPEQTATPPKKEERRETGNAAPVKNTPSAETRERPVAGNENLPENREKQTTPPRSDARPEQTRTREERPFTRDNARGENAGAARQGGVDTAQRNANANTNVNPNANRPSGTTRIPQPEQTVKVTLPPQQNKPNPQARPANGRPQQNKPAQNTNQGTPAATSASAANTNINNPVRNDPAQTDKTRQNVIRVRKQRKYVFPPLDLLKPADSERDSVVDNDDIYALEAERNAEKLKATLRNFGIGVRITGITRGPTVTRFEFKPDEGIKISRIVALTDDIALSLAASAVRMEAPIPGKPAIGIEIPNKTPSTVYIHDVLDSNEYKTAKSKLSVAIGKDIDGKTVITDLAKMPHLLIAGSTGSGKSVCINTMIMGILYGAAPDEVKFIMIDPKVVELGIYNNIPHLLIPVVTEPKKASAALAWAVSEVERRYRLFAENNVHDLANFNRCVKDKPEMAHLEKLPQIVIIIDELADLMMASPQDVERSIIRLAQKARAAGVHLVIATQRPSVDVITGIIKANIPSRIAFAVASQFDSRTILDANGAEKLLGRGDMLYHPLGFTKSARLQCAFVSDEEVEKVVDFIRNSYGAPEFDDAVSDAITATVEQSQKEKGGKGGGDKEQDNQEEGEGQEFKLICDAAELALAQGTLSTSSLQRRLRLGYSRAARIIDTLEEMGLLSRSDGQRPRQVLMTREQWKKGIEEMKADE